MGVIRRRFLSLAAAAAATLSHSSLRGHKSRFLQLLREAILSFPECSGK
jgi:hypothetical protein